MLPEHLGIGRLFERIQEAVIVADAGTQRVVLWNPAATDVFGYSSSEALELRVEALVPTYLRDRHRAGLSRYGRTGHGPFIDSGEVLDLPAVRKGGEEIRVELTLSPIDPLSDAGAEGRFVLAVVRDVTERKRAEEEIKALNETLETKVSQRTAELEAALAELLKNQDRLRESEKRFRSLVQNVSDVITIIEGDGTVRYVSPAVERVLGHRPEELIGTPVFGLYHPDDAERAYEDFLERWGISGVAPPEQVKLRHKDGSSRHMELVRNNLLDDPEVAGIVVTCRDITERKALEEQLVHRALHDPLTDLPNRTLLADRLRHALARTERTGARVALLFMDLDNFKIVNDSLGHDVGDRLLVAVSERLRACLRPQDTLARLGGDEFVVLLEDVEGRGDAIRVAQRIERELEAPFELGGQEIFVMTSTGIAFGGPGQEQWADNLLLRNADLAMYRAKQEGRARHSVFEEHMGREASERLRLEGELRRAIERDEFVLHYQPVVTMERDRNRIMGVEALLRWQHPERGLMYPAEFIDVAENTGLIVPIGRWVLREALQQGRRWQERYPYTPLLVVYVNISGAQFRSATLMEDISRAVEESGIDPGTVGLEITESIMMENAPSTVATLEKLNELGISLAVDDFGTGYSSLAYLNRFPLATLKIDRSFVAVLEEDSEDTLLVPAIIGLGKATGLKVIAEGVEDVEQATQLRRMVCDLAQGYYFSRPLPADAAEALLAKGTAP